MVDKLREIVPVPKWIIMLAGTVMMALFGFTFNFSRSFGEIQRQTEQNTTTIQKLQESKADLKLIERVETTLDRIENKLDNHISRP